MIEPTSSPTERVITFETESENKPEIIETPKNEQTPKEFKKLSNYGFDKGERNKNIRILTKDEALIICSILSFITNVLLVIAIVNT